MGHRTSSSPHAEALLRPSEAGFDPNLREFILDYVSVRRSSSPDEALLEFLQSTYEAAANAGRWDRAALERQSVQAKRG